MTISVFAQTQTITGTVTDKSDGSTLPGVTVMVEGTTIGVVTDFSGNYQIKVPTEATHLSYSFVGMGNKVIQIDGKSVINVELSSSSVDIEDVVIVGYGAQKKATVVGAITQTKGEELLKAGSVTTISEALTGLLPGVSTMQAAGQPGSTAADILIRGRASWSDSSPLYLVDGVERDFNDLDPNEIESISVLKDASATAVYGVKAANGVILVTTKTGGKGKPVVKFSGTMSIKDPTMDTDYGADMATNLEYFNLALMNDRKYDQLYPQYYIDRWRDPEYADNPFYQYVSFVNTLFGTGYSQQYNLNISGGNDFVSYFTSFGYNYDGDIFDLEKQPEFDPRTYQHRFNWRTNLDFNFTKSTKLSVKLAGNMTNWNGNNMTRYTNMGTASGAGNNILSRIYSAAIVHAPAVFEDGRLGYDPGNAPENYNYLGRLEREGSWGKKKNQLFTDFILKQNITKHLNIQGKFSYNYMREYLSQIDKRYNSRPMYYWVETIDGFNPTYDEDGNVVILPEPSRDGDFENPASVGNESLDNYNYSTYYEISANYNQRFGAHNVGALMLFQRRQNKYKANFPSYEEGWVGRVTYGYDDKYLFEANGAYNGNESFAAGNRFGFFPSVSLGWTLTQENFMKDNMAFVDFLKVRYSYGLIGSDKGLSGDNRWAYFSSYSSAQIDMGYGQTPLTTGWSANGKGLYVYQEGDPAVTDVTWETSYKQNLGIDFNILDNKLQTTLDLFKEERKDILMQRQTIPSWYGNEPPYSNMGETKNHGFDLEVTWNDNINDDWSYWLKGNLSISENRIVNKDDPEPKPEYRKDAGKPIGWRAGYQGMGLIQDWDQAFQYTPSSMGLTYMPGDLAYNDYNADGVIDINDQVAIGSPTYATKTYAFSGGVRFKGWSLVAMFNGMFDISKEVSRNYLYPYETVSSENFMLKNNEQKDAWTPWNTDTDTPILHINSTSHYSEMSTYRYRNSSFLRLRNVELKYALPKSLLKRTGFFKTAEFYVNGKNLYTWQKLPASFDPEAKQLEVYPITKLYGFGMRFSF